MFSKRTLVSGFVAFLTMSLVTTLIWMVLGSTWMNMSDVVMTVEQDKMYLTLAYLVIAWVMAFIFPFGYEGGSAVAEGFRFGVVIWALLSLSSGLKLQSVEQENIGAFLLDLVMSLPEYAVGGVVIGVIAARMGAATPAEAAAFEQ